MSFQKQKGNIKICRTEKDRDHTYIRKDSRAVNDSRLSFKARGLHDYIISKPEDWNLNEADIINHAKEGKRAVKQAIKELEGFGYLEKYKMRDEGVNL